MAYGLGFWLLGPWLDHYIGRDETVIASNGQHFGYYYNRKTIGLASLTYSREPWTEVRLRRVAAGLPRRALAGWPRSERRRAIVLVIGFSSKRKKGAARGGRSLEYRAVWLTTP